MKLFKKFLCCALLVGALSTCIQTTASASPINVTPGTCCSTHARKMHYYSSESGTVKFYRNSHTVYDFYVNGTSISYDPGEVLYYDSVYRYYNCKSEMMYTFVSYVNNSGDRRYLMTSYDGGGGKTYVDGLTVY